LADACVRKQGPVFILGFVGSGGIRSYLNCPLSLVTDVKLRENMKTRCVIQDDGSHYAYSRKSQGLNVEGTSWVDDETRLGLNLNMVEGREMKLKGAVLPIK